MNGNNIVTVEEDSRQAVLRTPSRLAVNETKNIPYTYR